MKLLAQVAIPGYRTDGPPGMFDGFSTLFFPAFPWGSLGALVARVVLFAILSAGLIFLLKLIAAGYEYLTSAGDSAKVQAATKNITNAAIGLFVVITAYFVIQVFEVIFGFKILS